MSKSDDEKTRVVRGSSFIGDRYICRYSYRIDCEIVTRSNTIGFRVVITNSTNEHE